jgi:hypothetical protein
MSIQRSIQTGVMIGQALQTAALRNQVAQMQRFAMVQQEQADAIASWRQLVFNARKILDEAERALVNDTIGACYSISLAYLNLNRLNESIFADFQEKEMLYQNQRRAADLLSHAQTLVSQDTAEHLHRLAWLDEVKIALLNLVMWLEVREKVDSRAIFFVPAPGLGRGVLLFFGGNIVGGTLAAMVFYVAHPLGIIIYFACNGITLVIADAIIRSKIIKDCHVMAQKAGGWVGRGFSPKSARVMMEQARTRLSSWDYRTAANSSSEANQELANIDQEITQLSEAYFPSNGL